MTTLSGAQPTIGADTPDTLLSDEIRVAGMVWERELIRYTRNRTRIVSGLMQPVLFLFVLGYGMSSLVGTTGGFNFRQFVFPGVVAMSVVMTAMFSAISIVWDREFGFLREMLVAPVSRTALVLGKTAGGASVAAVQGTIMLVLAPLVGVRLTPLRLHPADRGRAGHRGRLRAGLLRPGDLGVHPDRIGTLYRR